MDWNNYHNRAAVLRDVVAEVEARGDGSLPMDLPGVRQCFRGELDVVGALQLRWHARLVARIEEELFAEPRHLDSAVVAAWRTTATELAGVRAVIDTYTEHPLDAEMADALTTAHAKEHALLAIFAGLASDEGYDAASQAAGAALERRARAAVAGADLAGAPGPRPESLLQRLKATVVA